MDEREAFSRLVRTIFMRSWDRANPGQPRFFEIESGNYLTMRQVCDRVSKFDEPLPSDDVTDLKGELYAILDQDLQAKLKPAETYSMAATCVSRLIDRRLSERSTPRGDR